MKLEDRRMVGGNKFYEVRTAPKVRIFAAATTPVLGVLLLLLLIYWFNFDFKLETVLLPEAFRQEMPSTAILIS
jgi:hypothetical protein